MHQLWMTQLGPLLAYAANATATSALDASGSLLLLAGAVVLGLPGWLAYAGKWRRWTADPHGLAFPYFPFGVAWMGTGAALVSLASLIATLGNVAADGAYILLGIPGFATFFCGVVFLIWTPKRFLPAWYGQDRYLNEASRTRR